MDFGALLDAAISVAAVLLLFSLAASAINEAIADFINLRGRTLRRAVAKLLERTAKEAGAQNRIDDNAFFDDPDIRTLGRDRLFLRGGREPSALEPRRYALTVLKLLDEREAIEARAAHDFTALRRDVVAQVAAGFGHESDATARVDAIFDRIGAQAAATRSAIESRVSELEHEFNEMMDRASGWYLRRTRAMLFGIGLVLAVGANIDILHHADRVMRLENTRAQTDALAAMFGDELPDRVRNALENGPGNQSDDPAERIETTILELTYGLQAMQVRVGWECRPGPQSWIDTAVGWITFGFVGCGGADQDAGNEQAERSEGPGTTLGPVTAGKIIGWFIVAFGVTLGAQFWYDAFRRLVRLRKAGLVGGTAEAESERRA